MKTRIIQPLLFAVLLLPIIFITSKATEPDTLWTTIISPDDRNEIIKTMLSLDDSLIFVGFDDPGFIVVYNSYTGDSIRTIYPNAALSQFNNFDVSKNGKYLIAAERINNVYSDTIVNTVISVYNQRTGAYIRNVLGNDTNLKGFKAFGFLEFTPDSRYIFASLTGRGWKDYKGIWHDSIPWFVVIDTMNWQVQRAFQLPGAKISEFAVSPNNEYYAVSLEGDELIGWIEFRNIQNDSIIKVLADTSGNAPFFNLSFSPDSNYFICSDVGEWYIWDVNQNLYYRKYIFDQRIYYTPIGFTKYHGILSQRNIDTLTNIRYLSLFNFIEDTIVYKFQGYARDIIFLKNNNRFVINDWYMLVMYDSTWTPVTSIKDDNSNIDAMIVYPNPASDYIEISVGAQGAVPDKVSIFDILGMEITTLSLRDTPPYQGGEIVRLDISSLSPGVYFVRIGDVVRKFLKL